MEHIEYKTHGTCSREIIIDIDPENGTITDAKFVGGCSGNTQGVWRARARNEGRRGDIPPRGHPLRYEADVMPRSACPCAEAVYRKVNVTAEI